MLPNFICIGAQKSGTTTIWHLLNKHPDVCMAQPRETKFFYDDTNYFEGLPKYEQKYFGHWNGEKLVGEKCPEYLSSTFCAERIYHSLGPKIKFIVSLRSPSQRAFAHYRHNMSLLRECRSFDDALKEEEKLNADNKYYNDINYYIRNGYYSSQIKKYFQYFDKKQFLFLKFEDIFNSKQEILAKQLYDFLKIPHLKNKEFEIKTGNPPLDKLIIRNNIQNGTVEIEKNNRNTGLLNKIRNTFFSENLQIIKNPSVALIDFTNKFNQNKPRITHLDKSQELYLNRKYYKEDISELKNLVPINFDNWLL